jgi:hypothetical protein
MKIESIQDALDFAYDAKKFPEEVRQLGAQVAIILAEEIYRLRAIVNNSGIYPNY